METAGGQLDTLTVSKILNGFLECVTLNRRRVKDHQSRQEHTGANRHSYP